MFDPPDFPRVPACEVFREREHVAPPFLDVRRRIPLLRGHGTRECLRGHKVSCPAEVPLVVEGHLIGPVDSFGPRPCHLSGSIPVHKEKKNTCGYFLGHEWLLPFRLRSAERKDPKGGLSGMRQLMRIVFVFSRLSGLERSAR